MTSKSKPLTLEKAFKKIIYTRGMLTAIGYGRRDVANYKRYLKAGTITTDKMREVVRAAGAKCIQEELYLLPEG